MTLRTVAIVGAGLTGLACAMAAARAGAAVTVYEQRAAGGLPAHVDVVPNMLRDLARLGIGDACVRAGFPYRRTTMMGQRGTALFSLEATRLAGPRYPAAIGITHASLHRVLADAVTEYGGRIRDDAPVLHVEQAGSSARLHLDRGAPVHADLAVLACGASSGLRERVFGADALVAGPASFYCLAPRPRGLDDALHAATPAGDRVHLVPVSGSLVGVRLHCRRPLAALDAQGLRALLLRFPAPISDIAAHVGEDVAITRRAAPSGLLPQPWVRPALLAVGDCAHALPPHFGQAAAQGIEDAVVLGDLLAQPLATGVLTQAWQQRRMARVQQVMAIVRQAALWDAAPDGNTDLLALARALDSIVQQPA